MRGVQPHRDEPSASELQRLPFEILVNLDEQGRATRPAAATSPAAGCVERRVQDKKKGAERGCGSRVMASRRRIPLGVGFYRHKKARARRSVIAARAPPPMPMAVAEPIIVPLLLHTSAAPRPPPWRKARSSHQRRRRREELVWEREPERAQWAPAFLHHSLPLLLSRRSLSSSDSESPSPVGSLAQASAVRSGDSWRARGRHCWPKSSWMASVLPALAHQASPKTTLVQPMEMQLANR